MITKQLLKTRISWVLLGLILSAISLGQLQRWQITPGVAIYVHDLLIAAWLLLTAFAQRNLIVKTMEKIKWRQYWLEWGMVGWILLGTLLAQLAAFQLKPLLLLARLATYFIFALTLRLVLIQKIPYFDQLKQWRWGVVLSGLLVLVWGFLQYWLLPDIRFLAIMGWDDHYYRLVSTLFDPGFTGMLLILTFIYWQQLSIPKQLNRWSDFIKIGVSLLLIFGVMLTYSRASFVALGASLVLMLLLIKNLKKKITAFYLVLALILIPFLPRPDGEGVKLERTTSVGARWMVDQLAIQSMKPQHWLWGKGLFYAENNEVVTITGKDLDWSNHAQIPNNILVTLLTSTGVIGTGLIGWWLWRWGRELAKTDSLILVALLTTIVHSQFNNTLLQPFVLLMLLGGVVGRNNKLST